MELLQSSQNELLGPILDSMQPFIAGGAAITAIIVIFYIINSVMKWRSQKAVLDIRKTLKEMNERQKGNNTEATTPLKSEDFDLK